MHADARRKHACSGVVERLRISRAGNFSCPVRAGVVFLASFNADACGGSQKAVLQALQVQN